MIIQLSNKTLINLGNCSVIMQNLKKGVRTITVRDQLGTLAFGATEEDFAQLDRFGKRQVNGIGVTAIGVGSTHIEVDGNTFHQEASTAEWQAAGGNTDNPPEEDVPFDPESIKYLELKPLRQMALDLGLEPHLRSTRRQLRVQIANHHADHVGVSS